MALTPADLTPDEWIGSWSEDGTDITIPLASFTEATLTADEAGGPDGDIRDCLYSLCEEVYAAYTNMATADKPNRMTISRAQSINNSTNLLTKTYTFQFVCDPSGIDVAAEA